MAALTFDRYILDLDRGCLVRDGTEIPLRPKTFALLRYLAENRGRLVPKDELFAAVWPRLVVTDDVLVQSVGELRRALGDDGRRLITTVPRRGYRFERTAASVQPAAESSMRASNARRVARPRMLASLVLVTALAIGGWAVLQLRVDTALPDVRRMEPGKVIVAVLPFRNRGDASREYFADGMSQDVIHALGRFPELTVMSWNAVLPYKDSPARPPDVARHLGVEYQVEGSVTHTGDRVRVVAHLVAADGRVLWVREIDEALPELFAIYGRMTAEIAGALAIGVTNIEQQRAAAKPAESLEAYDYVLRARPAKQRPTRANNAEACAQLRRAIELDGRCAACFAGLAETYLVAVAMGFAESPTDALDRAESLAGHALRLDDTDVRAHVALGRVHTFRQRYDQAKAEMDRTLAINPSNADGLAGRGNVLMWMGQTDAAIECLEQAQRIDPELNAIDRFALSLAYYLKRRYDLAIAHAERNLSETENAHFSRVLLAAAYAQRNRTADATRVASVVRTADPTFDARAFGSKFLSPADLEHLRDGFRKAGLLAAEPAPRRSG